MHKQEQPLYKDSYFKASNHFARRSFFPIFSNLLPQSGSRIRFFEKTERLTDGNRRTWLSEQGRFFGLLIFYNKSVERQKGNKKQ